MQNHATLPRTRSRWEDFRKHISKTWVLYLLILPAFLDILIFHYFPLYGIQLAFRYYKAADGISGSPWVGMKYFIQFVSSPNFIQIIRNTLLLSFYNVVFAFPVPIFLAIVINEVQNSKLKKFTQMITYMPHFISMVAVVGIIGFIVNRESGIINVIRVTFGQEGIDYLGKSSAFRSIYVISEIWQNMGWSSIIYLAALAGVDIEVLEAARIDGANRFQKIRHIDLPTIMPTIVVLLILSAGFILNVGFEKVYLLQNDLNRDVSEIVATYTYRLGILSGQFSYTTAIGLFNNIINAIILVLVNGITRRLSGSSLW